MKLTAAVKLLLILNISGLVGVCYYHIINTDDVIRQDISQLTSLDDAAPVTSLSRRFPVKVTQERKWMSDYQVPNLVHFIWFNTKDAPLRFHHMLSILSADKFIKPDRIYFHTDRPPIGVYWQRVLKLPRLHVVKRNPPTTLFGEPVKPPKFYTSHSNVDRLCILSEYGGIYLDLDVFVTRPFDDLRHYICSFGQEQETKACGSVIVCSNTSVFLYMWLNSYLDDYRIDEWAYNTGKVPFNLARRYPHLVNMEPTRLNRPNFRELDKIWGDATFDWRHNYAVHTWYRLWKDISPYFHGVEPDEDNIKTLNNTFGQMARTILYGTSDLMTSHIAGI